MSPWLEKMGGMPQQAPLPAALGEREVLVDCSYPVEHAPAHHPHPDTGRLVCHICHPPAGVIGGKLAA